MKKYYPRIADKLLDEALGSAGAVLIEGPKWCGKTWTAAKKSKSIPVSYTHLTLPTNREV